MLLDLHVHTRNSDDAGGDPVEHVEQAVACGLDVLGISDHADFGDAPPIDVRAYRADLDRASGAAAGRLRLLRGVEVCWRPEEAGSIERTLGELDADYAIGSVHFVGDRALFERRTFAEVDLAEIYRRYRDAHLSLIASGMFDVVGHLDFPRRYLPRALHPRADELSGFLDEILVAIASSPLSLEVNTAGLRRGLGATSPSLALAHRFRELGGRRVAVGSDAHSPAEVGASVPEVTAALSALGLRPAPPRG